MDVISPADLWYSEEEEANFLASLGLGSISGIVTSSLSTKLTDLWPKDSIFMHKQREIGDAAQYQFDDKGGDSHLISSSPSSSSIGSTPQGMELSIYQQDSHVTVDEDSWSMEEEQMLRAAMADYIFMQPIIPWQRIAEALPRRTQLEVQSGQPVASDRSKPTINLHYRPAADVSRTTKTETATRTKTKEKKVDWRRSQQVSGWGRDVRVGKLEDGGYFDSGQNSATGHKPCPEVSKPQQP